MPRLLSALLLLVSALHAANARADEPPREAPSDWHAGLNLRTGPGTHVIRVGGGVRFGDLDLNLVLDPMFWTDGQVDTDLLASWRFHPAGWNVVGGWRGTSVGVVGDAQWQQKLVLGVGGPLPQLTSFLRASWTFELATVLVKHGGGLPTEVLSFASTRHFIDLLNFGMFVRFEYFSPLGGP